MKKSTKIISAILMVMMVLSVATTVFADFDPKGMDGKSGGVNTQKITDFGQNAVKIVTTVGMIASVVVLVVLGIKYMLGSAEEKAEYKKTMLPYVIGAVLVFAASSIASIVFSFAQGI